MTTTVVFVLVADTDIANLPSAMSVREYLESFFPGNVYLEWEGIDLFAPTEPPIGSDDEQKPPSPADIPLRYIIILSPCVGAPGRANVGRPLILEGVTLQMETRRGR